MLGFMRTVEGGPRGELDGGGLRRASWRGREVVPKALLEALRRRAPREPREAGRVDPERVEAELYDAIYGARTGTVENIAPLDRSTRGAGRRAAGGKAAARRA
jgi:hypothetical protein